MEQDRLFVDKDKIDFIRNINKNNEYLKFDNQKDLFMYAMSLGINSPIHFKGSKEGLFLEKDLNYEDMALIYSSAFSEIENIDDLINKEKVFSIVQNMANMGFSIIKEEMDNTSFENLTIKLLAKLDDKFKKITEDGLLEL